MILGANAGPLHDAAKIGDTKAISAALDKGADVNESDGIVTPLYLAASGGHVEAVKQLIEHGADVNLPAKWGTPASIAAAGCNIEMLKLLLKAGADPNTTWRSVTLLHKAAEKGSLDCVKLLIEAGAEVNALTSERTPPIHLAKRNGHEALAKFLVEHGAGHPALAAISGRLKTGDVDKGKATFNANCLKCHLTDQTAKPGGPGLWGVVGRAQASASGFEYSQAMKDSGGVWDYETINEFISDPAVVLPGTSMIFRGIQDENSRVDLIAFLRTLADDPQPLPAN
jgi:cytochrome c